MTTSAREGDRWRQFLILARARPRRWRHGGGRQGDEGVMMSSCRSRAASCARARKSALNTRALNASTNDAYLSDFERPVNSELFAGNRLGDGNRHRRPHQEESSDRCGWASGDRATSGAERGICASAPAITAASWGHFCSIFRRSWLDGAPPEPYPLMGERFWYALRTLCEDMNND